MWLKPKIVTIGLNSVETLRKNLIKINLASLFYISVSLYDIISPRKATDLLFNYSWDEKCRQEAPKIHKPINDWKDSLNRINDLVSIQIFFPMTIPISMNFLICHSLVYYF